MSVTAAGGFRAAGITAGLKPSGTPDLALVVNDGPADAAAGVFTRNQVQAAPVLWSRQVLAEGRLRAVVLNSGGANACTGPLGFQTTHATAEWVAEALGRGAVEVAVCSTGLIGEQLPRDIVLSGVDAAASSLAGTEEAGLAAATAVLTTDTQPKQASHRNDSGFTVGGFAKGAGMTAPAMATMLAVLTTDAVADAATVDAALRAATRVTFDRLDIDGGCSTNDTVVLLASGASEVPASVDELTAAVTDVCGQLSRLLQADAEGVTKRVAITVAGAKDERDAVTAARAVARDSLVKTALFGCDPNWGRIAMAVGAADAAVDPERLDITVQGVRLCAGGVAAGDRAAANLSGPDVAIDINLHLGEGAATVLTTDLSHGYVEENSAYST